MAASDHVDEIRRQILDEDRRSWTISECGGDADVFRTQCVAPLRTLQQRGCFEIYEFCSSVRGRKYVSRVDIISGINLDI
jgi:hypothetical protein